MAVSKLNVGGSSYDLRDAASLHYRGHFTEGLSAGASDGTYTGTPSGLSHIAEQDYITYGADNLNLVCTNISDDTTPVITWTSTSEIAAAPNDATITIAVTGENDQTFTVNQSSDQTINVNVPVKGVQVNGTDLTPDSSTHKVNINAIPASILTTGTTITAGVLTGTPTADGELANKKYVDDATVLAGHMKYCGTLGATGDNPTITALPVDGTADIGDTYKVITAATYESQEAKVGDLFICLTKETSTNTWTYVPSGDDVDVTSVDVSTGLSTTLPSGQSGTAITTTGIINLKLKNGSTAFSSAAEAQGATYRVCPVGVDAADAGASYAGGNLAVAIPAGTLATTVSDVQATNTAVASISNTGADGSGTGAFLAGHVGTGADADTLYFDYITPEATATNVVTKTS